MAKKKYYAVRQGHVPGIYGTWGDCQKQTNGYSGAEFKSFNDEEEAKKYLSAESSTSPITEISSSNSTITEYINHLDENTLVAFVDGSCDIKSQMYGYGVVLVNRDGNTEEIIGSDNNKSYVESRNVAGEIEGVKTAISHALAKGYRKIAIFLIMKGLRSGQLENGKPIPIYRKITLVL